MRAEEDRAAAIAQPQDQRAHVAAAKRIEADIGSSKNTSSGSLMSACAIPTRCSMPFENLRSCSRRSAPMPTSSRRRAARSRRSAPRDSRRARRSSQQLFGGQVVVEIGILGQVADAPFDGEIAERAAQNLGVAGGRENQLHQQLQRGRFARAVGAEKAEDLARLDLEGQAIERAIGALAPEADARSLSSARGSQAACHRSAIPWPAAARRRSR